MIRARCSSQVACGRPCYYTTLFSVCQEVFEKFFKNFCGIFCRSRSSIRWPLAVSLHIIALLILFVKRFFESFFGLESSAVCHKNVVAFLCILIERLGKKEKEPAETNTVKLRKTKKGSPSGRAPAEGGWEGKCRMKCPLRHASHRACSEDTSPKGGGLT